MCILLERWAATIIFLIVLSVEFVKWKKCPSEPKVRSSKVSFSLTNSPNTQRIQLQYVQKTAIHCMTKTFKKSFHTTAATHAKGTSTVPNCINEPFNVRECPICSDKNGPWILCSCITCIVHYGMFLVINVWPCCLDNPRLHCTQYVH